MKREIEKYMGDLKISTKKNEFRVNPECATYVEMRALEAHLGVAKRNCYPPLPMGGYGEMGLNDRGNFMDMFEKAV